MNKSYNFVTYLVPIFTERKFKINKRKRNSGGLCECHMFLQTFINVNWEKLASMLCKPNMSSQICCTNVCLDGHSNMLELFQGVFISWGTKEKLSPSSLAYNDPGQFEAFQVENIVVHYFTSNVTSWKQPCGLGVIPAVKKRYKFFVLKGVLSFYRLDNDHQ